MYSLCNLIIPVPPVLPLSNQPVLPLSRYSAPAVVPFSHVREKRGIEGVRRTEGVYLFAISGAPIPTGIQPSRPARICSMS